MGQKLKFVVHACSSEDASYPARELHVHSPHTRGWQSERFPQDIVLRLESTSHIQQIQLLSHEYKIASKVELYVGAPPAGSNDYTQCAMKRLGHVSFDNNERSGHQARELKSIHVDVSALLVRLVLHKCHPNSLNMHSQVGIVALNIIGERLDSSSPQLASAFSNGVETTRHASNGGGRHSSAEEDAAVLDVDAVTAQKIKEVLRQKEEAVRAEDYDEAKRLKMTIDKLRALGLNVAKLEAKKRAAVENEDYDLAKAIKAEIDRVRTGQQQDSNSYLHQQHVDAPISKRASFNDNTAVGVAKQQLSSQPIIISPSSPISRDNPSASAQMLAMRQSMDRRRDYAAYDDRPLPPPKEEPEDAERIAEQALIASNKQQQQQQQGGSGNTTNTRERAKWDRTPNAPASFKAPVDDVDDDNKEVAMPSGEGYAADLPAPEQMSEAALKENALLVELVGQYTVMCLYSRNWLLREAALQKIDREITARQYSASPVSIARLICQVIMRAMNDKVANIFHDALQVLSSLVTTFASDVGPRDLPLSVSEIIPALVERTGDSNARMRDAAAVVLLQIAACREIGIGVMIGQIFKPVKNQQLVPRFGVVPANGGLSTESVMTFVKAACSSPNGDVRTAAVRVTVEVYKLLGPGVDKYIKSLKPQIKDVMTQAFEKAAAGEDVDAGTAAAGGVSRPWIDWSGQGRAAAAGTDQTTAVNAAPQPTTQAKPATTATTTATTTTQQASARSRAGSAVESAPPAIAPGRPAQSTPPKQVEKPAAAVPTPTQAESDGYHTEDDHAADTCQFCGRTDASFLEGDHMDLHFYHDCPMLCSCAECGQIIEIASVNEHLLEECEEMNKYRECPRCKEAVPVAEYIEHEQRLECLPAQPREVSNRCPLCHTNIPPDESGWRTHLLTATGCPQNPRHLV
eukprot:jgi/Chlat1/7457/Chrsp6S07499